MYMETNADRFRQIEKEVGAPMQVMVKEIPRVNQELHDLRGDKSQGLGYITKVEPMATEGHYRVYTDDGKDKHFEVVVENNENK